MEGCKRSSNALVLFYLVCRQRLDLLVSQMLTTGLENYMHLHLFLTENTIIYVSFKNRGRITSQTASQLAGVEGSEQPKASAHAPNAVALNIWIKFVLPCFCLD